MRVSAKVDTERERETERGREKEDALSGGQAPDQVRFRAKRELLTKVFRTVT